MDTDRANLIDEGLTASILACFYAVYNELGGGFLESVYENALAIALEAAGIPVARQVALRVRFRGHVVGDFKIDLLVDNRVVVEIKAVSHLAPSHEVQLVNYLKGTGIPVGLLLNFGPVPKFKRRVFVSKQS